ncbi:putative odorant receptor 85d [Leptopilina heterotoma]|uniref:putative odorant receptor 85d n=1 Tax=Leptopilina heterotoma TaxID=63436 RepID=UPI001CA9FD49|nr:putative odorant receptor 85d [Leptopilina heterotoma]
MFQDEKIRKLFEQILHDWEVWHNEPQIKLLEQFAEEGRRINYIYAVAVCASASSYTIFGLAPYIYYSFVPNSNKSRESYQVPEKYVPSNGGYIYISIAYNLLSLWTNSIIFITADSIYFSLVQHSCGLFAAVGNRFEAIGKKYSGSTKMSDILYCILKYNSALKFAAELNEIYSIYFFFTVGINAANIIFAASQTIIHFESSTETVKFGNYGILMVGLFFLNSFPAQKLIDRSFKITQNIYNSNWYEMPTSIRKSLFIVLLRASNLCTINVGKICILSLQTFSTVVRTTVSMCMMILSLR